MRKPQGIWTVSDGRHKCSRRPEITDGRSEKGGKTLPPSGNYGRQEHSEWIVRESLLSGRILELYDDDTIGSVVFLQARFVLQHGNAFDLLRVQRLED